jgi:hypothetical protein|tara:strand:- start:287 stop:469 length:183 start_codon:yes stop_codon:yes gene_type:complete
MNSNTWYLMMIISILMAVLLFLNIAGYENSADARQVGVFVGLWAPTFGILGVRSQLNEKS